MNFTMCCADQPNPPSFFLAVMLALGIDPLKFSAVKIVLYSMEVSAL